MYSLFSRKRRYLYYRPQRSCEGYVITPVCHFVHRGLGGWGWGSASVHAWIPHLPRTRHPPPGTRHPPGPDLPGPGTPRDQIPLGPDPPRPGTPSRTRHTPPPRGPDPSYQAPGTPPPREQRWLLLRTVRILLECILVTSIF